MGTTFAASVHTQHYADAPTPTDGLVVTLFATGQDDLSHDTVTEHDDDECSNEFREGILQRQPDSGPKELGIGLVECCGRGVSVEWNTPLDELGLRCHTIVCAF